MALGFGMLLRQTGGDQSLRDSGQSFFPQVPSNALDRKCPSCTEDEDAEEGLRGGERKECKCLIPDRCSHSLQKSLHLDCFSWNTLLWTLCFVFLCIPFKIYFWTTRQTLLSRLTQQQLLKSNLGIRVTPPDANNVFVIPWFWRALWKTDSQSFKYYDGSHWLSGAEGPYKRWSANTGMFVSHLPNITKNFLSSQFLWLSPVMSKDRKLIFSDLSYCQIPTLL